MPKIDGQEIIGELVVQPDKETELFAHITRCTCPATPLRVHPVSRELAMLKNMSPNQATELLKQQGWKFRMSYDTERSTDG